MGPKLGILLFQLPPSFRKDVDTLAAFVGLLPRRTRAAFEFRHSSWHSDDVYELLRARNLALCISDTEDTTTPLVSAADYGYFRLRDEGYQEEDIRKWGSTILKQGAPLNDSFVYFKHESAGKGPEFGRMLLEFLAGHEAEEPAARPSTDLA